MALTALSALLNRLDGKDPALYTPYNAPARSNRPAWLWLRGLGGAAFQLG
jgi:hypothetical protein